MLFLGSELDPRLVDDVAMNVFKICTEKTDARFSHALHDQIKSVSTDLVTLSYANAELIHSSVAKINHEMSGAANSAKFDALVGKAASTPAKKAPSPPFGHNIKLSPPSTEVLASDAPEYASFIDLSADAAASFNLRTELTFDLDKAREMQEKSAALNAQHSFAKPAKDTLWLEQQIKVIIGYIFSIAFEINI